MKRALTILAAISAAPAVAAAPVPQFNLTCSGTLSTKSIAGDEAEPYSFSYRIDLARKKWCNEECKTLFDIHSIQPALLTLQYKNVDGISERSLLSNTINRETGEHKLTITSATPGDRFSTLILDWVGSCERAPFTGFPPVKTKF